MPISKIQQNSIADSAVHGQRNLVINGAMQVWQRGTSSSSTNDLVSVDRYIASNTTKFDQSTDTPSGFEYSLLLGNSSATFPYAEQRVEASAMKQTEGKSLTISFYAKATSSVPNLFAELVSPSAEDNYTTATIRFNKVFTSPSSSWTYYETTYTSPHAELLNGASLRIGLQNQGAGDLYLTGVQLEVGEATPFEHRSFADELARCQRYFQKSGNIGTNTEWFPGVATYAGYGKKYAQSLDGTNDRGVAHVTFPVYMRARPTLTVYPGRPGVTNTAGSITVYNGNTLVTSSSKPASDCNGLGDYFQGTSTDSAAYSYHYTVDAEL